MLNLTNDQIDSVFDRIVGAQNNYRRPADKAKYEKGYRYGQGLAFRVLRPSTNEQLKQILQFCNEHKIAIVPQGGNTGLVSASTPDMSATQIILSTELLNKHLFELDTNNKTVTAGSAWVLDALNEKLSPSDLFLPIDIGSSGSCNIGGMVATNAAGTRSGRYGNVKKRLLSCEVILANGTTSEIICIQGANPHQDNSRIDEKNPFVGSQGWLGIITSATFKLTAIPLKKESMVIVPSSPAAIGNILDYLLQKFGNKLTAFEGMSDTALKLVAKNIPNAKYLFTADPSKTQEHDYALLIEISGTDKNDNPEEELLQAFEHLLEGGMAITGLLGKSHEYWFNRHYISEALAKEGSVIATDIAVMDRKKLADFRIETTIQLQEKYPYLIIAPFGHEMLGALHFNVIWPKDKSLTSADKRAVQEFIYDKIVHKYNGTFSAEHGIGPHNQWAYDKYTPQAVKDVAKQLKREYDPSGIFNPNINYGC